MLDPTFIHQVQAKVREGLTLTVNGKEWTGIYITELRHPDAYGPIELTLVAYPKGG